VAEAEGEEHRAAKEERAAEADEEGSVRRWGSREAVIEEVRLLAGDGVERYHLECGEAVTFELQVRAQRPLRDFVFGVAVSTPRGIECWGTNTDMEGYAPVCLEGRATVRVHCPALRLGAGEYLLDAAVHARDGAPYDYRKGVLSFTVTARDQGLGLYLPRHSWQAEGGVDWRPPPLAPKLE
jgi:hypothetical protein